MTSPGTHAGPGCACGFNELGEWFTDPICTPPAVPPQLAWLVAGHVPIMLDGDAAHYAAQILRRRGQAQDR